MPIKVNSDCEWENHFNLVFGEALAVKVIFFSQRCLYKTYLAPPWLVSKKVLQSRHIKDPAAQSLPQPTAAAAPTHHFLVVGFRV